jgi:hypothetical protein
VHDAVRLERRGVPTIAVGTLPFVDEALEQARLLGMPDYRMAWVGHPVQLLDRAGVEALADGVLDVVVAALTR